MSCKTLSYVAGVIRRHLKAIGSRWRKLNPGQEAVPVLAYLRKGETFAELAAGFGVGRTTARRYVGEVVALLAAPGTGTPRRCAGGEKGRARLRDPRRHPHPDRPGRGGPALYSGKHKKHGINLQVIASPDGNIRWVSEALPGAIHDKKAE